MVVYSGRIYFCVVVVKFSVVHEFRIMAGLSMT